jgi:predicted secreted Zn-dependent protease
MRRDLIAAILAAFALLTLLAVPASADVTRKTYDVDGSNADELIASMQSNGPEGWWGFTRYDWSYTYEFRRTTTLLVIATATADLKIVVTLPKWVGREAASPCMRASWDAMLVNLEKHELVHVELTNGLDKDILEAILAIPPQNRDMSNEQLSDLVAATVKPIATRYNLKHIRYDNAVAHGAKDPYNPVILQECP